MRAESVVEEVKKLRCVVCVPSGAEPSVCLRWTRVQRRPWEASLSERTIQRLRTAGAEREGEKKAACSNQAGRWFHRER